MGTSIPLLSAQSRTRPTGRTSSRSSCRPTAARLGPAKLVAQMPPRMVTTIAMRMPHHGGHASARRPEPPKMLMACGSALRAHGHGGGHLGEEIVPLVVDDDERGEVLDLDAPHRLHA